MQMFTRSVTCPLCGAHASVTLVEDRDPLRDTEGHEIRFECSARRHTPTDTQLLRLWAAARAGVNA